MQRLAIDIGNSSTKLAVYQNSQMVLFKQLSEPEIQWLRKTVKNYPEIKSSILASVRDYPKEIDEWLADRFFHIDFTNKIRLPFINQYSTPETLGKDRIAAVAAATKLFPETNVLIIDAGTSITYDLITKNNIYLGGGISPGIEMRFRALHTFTGKLPLVTKIDDTPLIGNSTQKSILSGVLNGVVAEVEGIIYRYSQQFEKLKIIISGGDYKYFDKKLKNSIFATPNIVMQGLMEILKFNEH